MSADLPSISLPPPPTGAFDLLNGVRVLDLTTSLAGPYAGQVLGDLGADVVKIERPGSGDDARSWGPPFLDGFALWFLSVNRNKRSLTLDYANPRGREILGRLVSQADATLLNLRPSVLAKLGIDEAGLRAHRADLIYCSITGFGLTGARRDWPGYDLIAEGYSGVMDLTGEPDGPPQKVGTPAADLLAGKDAAQAILAALFDRQRTGRGHCIDVSLIESMTGFMAPRIVPYLGSGEIMHRSGARDSVIAVYQTFETADSPMTLGLGNDVIFRRFCGAVGRPDWAEDPANADNVGRRNRRQELVDQIQAELRRQPRAHWLELFAAQGVPAGPINAVDEVVRDSELLARGLFYAVPGLTSPMPQVGTGWHLDGRPNGCRLPPPALGAHTEAVLAEWIGLEPAETARLREEGIA